MVDAPWTKKKYKLFINKVFFRLGFRKESPVTALTFALLNLNLFIHMSLTTGFLLFTQLFIPEHVSSCHIVCIKMLLLSLLKINILFTFIYIYIFTCNFNCLRDS